MADTPSKSPIEIRLGEMLKAAMRAKDQRSTDCIRMIKTRHMERRTASGFKGELDDALWQDVIAGYQKQMRKSRAEYAAAGEKGADFLPQLDFEIEFCAQFLPKAMSDDELRAVVKEAAGRLGITDPKQAGRLVGDVMKAHKGKVEPGAVKAMADKVLAGS